MPDILTGANSTTSHTMSVRSSPLAGPPVYKSIQTPDPFETKAPTANTKEASIYDPDKIQVGGNHYAKQKMQPIELVMANEMGFCEGSALKYICRHQDKGGAEDIKKAIHYLQLLLKHKYGTTF